ncbi:MAG: LamB/YcsF family protein [Hyphomicrobiaceae bacterium]
MQVEVETICLHGDEPTSVHVAQGIGKALAEAGIANVTIPEMLSA